MPSSFCSSPPSVALSLGSHVSGWGHATGAQAPFGGIRTFTLLGGEHGAWRKHVGSFATGCSRERTRAAGTVRGGWCRPSASRAQMRRVPARRRRRSCRRSPATSGRSRSYPSAGIRGCARTSNRSRPTPTHEDRLPMQPIRRPIGRDVAAVSPDGADLHAADRLPDVLTIVNLSRSNHLTSVGGDDPVWYWRRFLIDPETGPPKDRERQQDDESKPQPEPSQTHPVLLKRSIRDLWRV